MFFAFLGSLKSLFTESRSSHQNNLSIKNLNWMHLIVARQISNPNLFKRIILNKRLTNSTLYFIYNENTKSIGLNLNWTSAYFKVQRKTFF